MPRKSGFHLISCKQMRTKERAGPLCHLPCSPAAPGLPGLLRGLLPISTLCAQPRVGNIRTCGRDELTHIYAKAGGQNQMENEARESRVFSVIWLDVPFS